MKYTDYIKTRQQEFNDLPVFYAFSDKQLEKQLAERGIKLEDAGKMIYKLGGTGGFYLKKDADVIKAYFEKDRDAELRGMMEKDLSFAYEAFEYEMYNHEYPINWEGDYDVCSCFGGIKYGEEKYGSDYLKELGFSDAVIKQYIKAGHTVQKSVDW